MSRTILLLLLCGLSVPAAHAEVETAKSSVRYSDVKNWRPVGARWAEGFDGAGKLIAIYDLSYPSLFGILPLGKIGGERLSLKEMNQVIAAAKSPGVDEEEFVRKAAQIPEHQTFPDQWWKSIPWKADFKSDAEPPARFALADIDFTRATKDFQAFDKKVKGVEGTTDSNSGERVLPDGFLNRFHFVRQPDGAYEMSWGGDATGTDLPVKVVDFTSDKDAVVQGLLWDGMKLGLGEAAGLIPIPILSGIVATAVDRFFHFREILNQSHERMLLELINGAEDATHPGAPFAELDLDQRLAAGVYIYYTGSKFSNVWEWVLKPAGRAWSQDFDVAAKNESLSLAWLNSHGESVDPLNSWYAEVTTSAHDKEIVLLSRSKPSKKNGPVVAIDYSNPDRIYAQRIVMEALDAAVKFGTHMIPVFGVGTVVNGLYSLFVEDPIAQTKYWEARLEARLEERARSSGENWDVERDSLFRQRVSLFDLPRAGAEALVLKRSQEMGLH